jgi:hypothetical protein
VTPEALARVPWPRREPPSLLAVLWTEYEEQNELARRAYDEDQATRRDRREVSLRAYELKGKFEGTCRGCGRTYRLDDVGAVRGHRVLAETRTDEGLLVTTWPECVGARKQPKRGTRRRVAPASPA